ncbi:MAG: XTP/dITP diphosphatase [Lachnospiraceae bacterium]|nr:XTP/dITP diphosphatase [Lachnospiraceae bacterium]
MTTLVMATGNSHKLREIREILKGTDFDVVPMKAVLEDTSVVEDGTTFMENALKKARTIAARCGCPTLSDDSGLVIDALGGEPGIYSARYMGEDTPYPIKNQALLDRLKDVPAEERTARFVCAMACVFPDGRELTVEETFEGRIADEIAGINGFGYDPIFYVPERQCTSAELSEEEKNAVSHRGKALRHMKELLTAL